MTPTTLHSQQYIPLEWDGPARALVDDVSLQALSNTDTVTDILGTDLVRDISSRFMVHVSGQAAVYPYQATADRSYIIAKVFKPISALESDFHSRRAAANEAYASRLLHLTLRDQGLDENVVRYLGGVEAHTADNKYVPILWFERVGNGKTLSDLSAVTDEERLPLRFALRALIPMGKVLAEGEKNNIVHRDVKPANIFLSAYGHTVLGDFGCATQISEETSETTYGTPRYMAPEAYDGIRTPHIDCFGFGASLYKLVTGAYPYPQSLDSMRTDFTGTPIRPSERREIHARRAVNTEFDSIVLGLLEKDPAVRMRWSEALPRLENLAQELKVYQHL